MAQQFETTGECAVERDRVGAVGAQSFDHNVGVRQVPDEARDCEWSKHTELYRPITDHRPTEGGGHEEELEKVEGGRGVRSHLKSDASEEVVHGGVNKYVDVFLTESLLED